MEAMKRFVVALLLVVGLTGLATAEPDGLARALDRQQQDMQRQQSQVQQTTEAQRQQLQQQQDQALRLQLLQPPRPLSCTKVGSTVFCQ